VAAVSTRFCPSCGAEYLAGIDECSDCQVPLTDEPPDEREEVGYDLTEWSEAQLERLSLVLRGAGIPFAWEDAELVVGEQDVDRVEAILDEVEDEPIEALEEDPEADASEDEATYQAVSELYVAVDRLMHSIEDAGLVRDYVIASEELMERGVPFGVDPSDWKRICERVEELRNELGDDGADPELVAAHARELREVFAAYV
jgi:hypothetical protein